MPKLKRRSHEGQDRYGREWHVDYDSGHADQMGREKVQQEIGLSVSHPVLFLDAEEAIRFGKALIEIGELAERQRPRSGPQGGDDEA